MEKENPVFKQLENWKKTFTLTGRDADSISKCLQQRLTKQKVRWNKNVLKTKNLKQRNNKYLCPHLYMEMHI